MAEQIGPQASYDVVVIGAGIAGLTAARRSQGLGASVALMEKGTENDANNSRRSGGAFHAATYDPRIHPADELYEAIMRFTDGHARPDNARSWADNVLRALQFLESEGGHFEKRHADEAHWNVAGPEPRVQEELTEVEPKWKGAANDRLLTMMTNSFIRDGGSYRNGTRAVALEAAGGSVVGVHVQPVEGGSVELVNGRAVIMCDGGFQSNLDLVKKYITKHAFCNRCGELETGDCLQMAMAIGAKAVELDAAYQMVALRDRLTHPHLPHPPSPTWLMRAAIVVNGNGERLGDEAAETPPTTQGDGAYPSNQYADKRLSGLMSRTDAPGDSWVVFDDECWETAGRQTSERQADPSPMSRALRATALNPTILEHGGTFLSASTIAELATLTGLPVDRLQRTVDGFNRFCRDGSPIDPPRTARARPIEKAPFHAIPLIPGYFFTMGGVLVNGKGQVLNEQEHVIPGLYAAGGTMGGLMGGPRDGYHGGWSEAATFGMLGAEHAVTSFQLVGAR